ncbi:MAG: phosphatase PAP2 family protein [Magnetospirillum sp.]|nr:phosphatase PAP2 family protein [Magnetospirillum sp.]
MGPRLQSRQSSRNGRNLQNDPRTKPPGDRQRAKSSWDRARPYQRDIRVQPCVNKPSNSSYPSGHSAESAIWAALLGAAFPDKAAIFEAIVEETMWSRIIGGVHYPTDTQAGLMLGREIARHLLASEDTQTAIATIRAETLARIQTR